MPAILVQTRLFLAIVKLMRLFLQVLMLSLLSGQLLLAADKPRVLILDIENIEQRASLNWVENTISNALRTRLNENFSFEEISKSKWQPIAEKNHFSFTEEYYTKTVALQLGLVLKQDYAIGGGYKQIDNEIICQVHLFEVGSRKLVKDLKLRFKKDNNIFASVDKMVAQIIEQFADVLPRREDFVRTYKREDITPLLNQYHLGLRVGGNFLASGFADKLKPEQPLLILNFQAKVPKISTNFALIADFTFSRHIARSDKNPAIEDFTLVTNNFILGLYSGYDFHLGKHYILQPHVGGGATLQLSEATGPQTASFTNSLPMAAAGFDFAFLLNSYFSLALTVRTYVQFESDNVTLLNGFAVGANFWL